MDMDTFDDLNLDNDSLSGFDETSKHALREELPSYITDRTPLVNVDISSCLTCPTVPSSNFHITPQPPGGVGARGSLDQLRSDAPVEQSYAYFIIFPIECTAQSLYNWLCKYICYGQYLATSEPINPDTISPIQTPRTSAEDERDTIPELHEEDITPSYATRFYNHYWTNPERPKWVGSVGPWILVTTVWLLYMSISDSWYRITRSDDGYPPGWTMTIVALFGSIVGGATSEGSGSVAFPFMTLVLGIPTEIARDYSLLQQCVGMTAASFNILYSRFMIERLTLIYGTVCGAIGLVTGLLFIAPYISDDDTKLIYVSIWLAFAITLFALNRAKGRKHFLSVPDPTFGKILWIMVVGLLGGWVSALVGSGLDICLFSLLTLYFRVSEKVGTPTTVVLMAAVSFSGVIVRVITGGLDDRTIDYWISAIPVVTLGAPVGAFFASFLHRQVLASFVYVTDVLQFIICMFVTDVGFDGFILILVFVFGGLFGFGLLAFLGQKMYVKQKQNEASDGPFVHSEVFCKLLCCLVLFETRGRGRGEDDGEEAGQDEDENERVDQLEDSGEEVVESYLDGTDDVQTNYDGQINYDGQDYGIKNMDEQQDVPDKVFKNEDDNNV